MSIGTRGQRCKEGMSSETGDCCSDVVISWKGNILALVSLSSSVWGIGKISQVINDLEQVVYKARFGIICVREKLP